MNIWFKWWNVFWIKVSDQLLFAQTKRYMNQIRNKLQHTLTTHNHIPSIITWSHHKWCFEIQVHICIFRILTLNKLMLDNILKRTRYFQNCINWVIRKFLWKKLTRNRMTELNFTKTFYFSRQLYFKIKLTKRTIFISSIKSKQII